MFEWAHWRRGLTFASLLAMVAGIGMALARPALDIGSPVPDLRLKGIDGRTYSLRDFKGTSWVVLAWYIRASTPG